SRRNHHRPRLTADLVKTDHLLMKVIDHDLGLLTDRMLVAFDVATKLLSGLLDVKLRITWNCLHQTIIAIDWRVILQHVDDEALFNRLLHRIAMEWSMFRLFAFRVWVAEYF